MEARKLSKSEPPPFELSLRIRHPSMDPADLSRQIGIEATHSFRAGEPRQSHSGQSTASVYGESYWLGILDSTAWPAAHWLSGFANMELAQKAHDETVVRSLGWALSMTARRLLRTNAALLERIRNEGGQVGLLVALTPTAVDGFSLTPEVSRMFSDLGITLEFEMTAD
jgi:hypothetical protein